MTRTAPSHLPHPLAAVALAGSFPLLLGAALSDAAYASSYEVQWINFASWLLVGALVFAGVALVFAIIDVARKDRRTRATILHAAVLLTVWIVGFVDVLVHARDAWASMPAGLVLSIIATLLAGWAVWLVFWNDRTGNPQ